MGEVPTGYGILVGVDGSAESDAAIRWATCEATMRGEPITVMHVVPRSPNGRRLLGNQRSRRYVVVGCHGRGGFPGMLLGSVGSALAQSAKAPLIIHRAG